ncbi:MAG: indolepyruvate ferredoxin oxidoreductase subunit alpha [Deltaproteobacteria bacterium]|nr:indolepyruvate ferredoxin oxidoreductase subunit alpha [Deltaproteobacteria bacterium]
MGAERSFAQEVESLRLGAGEVFYGEGILAVTKALLQSGVAYVGGYQGAPVSHMIDVLLDAEALMAEMGIHVEVCANEAAAAAMLGASINYPLRGAVSWKSIVGTNVAADGLANLSSPGVLGGALVIVGEDYGEGASVIQERTHAMAMKSGLWLLDPRPNLSSIVQSVEQGFELSEATNTPVLLQLRVRACHVQGRFSAKDNRLPAVGTHTPFSEPASFDYLRLAHPPVSFVHEKLKIEQRLPRAHQFIQEHHLNEQVQGDVPEVGIILQGGLYNTLARRLNALDLSDAFGNSRIPLLILNVVHPLVPGQITGFCQGKKAVLVLEEGNPEYIEHQVNVLLRKSDLGTAVFGKDLLPPAGEYTADVIEEGLVAFLEKIRLEAVDPAPLQKAKLRRQELRAGAANALPVMLPPRPPQFCTGCPERPVYSAIKILEQEVGKVHISADIGCHALATFEPFSLGNSILGYGMSLASTAAVAPFQGRRSISIMGDGGFWHNGLITGVIGTLMNRGDSILIIMQNGYTSATGQQFIPSSSAGKGGEPTGMDIERTLVSLGVPWLRTVRSYSVSDMIETLREALTTSRQGLKVIIADGECQLARQRKLKGVTALRLETGRRVETPRFGVDESVCTGDHSCIRLSGCPSLTLKPSSDPLRLEPVTTIDSGCAGCGLCGEVAHAAVLCPAFYRVDRVQNPGWMERLMHGIRRSAIGWLDRLASGAA